MAATNFVKDTTSPGMLERNLSIQNEAVQGVDASKKLEHLDEDDLQGMLNIGKTQAFERRFSIWTAVAMTFCMLATVRTSGVVQPSKPLRQAE